MAINPAAVGSTAEPAETTWTSKDSLLYALGVGAGTEDLSFTTENSANVTQLTLPTMGVVLANTAGAFAKIGDFNPAMLVHGAQRIECHADLPVSGSLNTVPEITGIHDKVKGAVVEVTSVSSDTATSEPLFTTVMTLFIRGEGGWGGDRGPQSEHPGVPDRTAEHSIAERTLPQQALIYRLSGDRNPLHSDPSFAAMAGFDRPILHGLCTYGFAGRALLKALCDDDPSTFGSMDGRFSAPVFPGEELTTSIWVDGDAAIFRTCGEDGRVVLDQGRFTRRHAS